MTAFKFQLQDTVAIKISGETGYVIARSESVDMEPQYLVRYKAADGRGVETWWQSSALTVAEAAGYDAMIAPPWPTPAQAPVDPTPLTLAGNGSFPTALTPAQIGVELDADGVPWDETIHASTKGKNQDGRWKKRRNVSDAQAAAAVAPAQAALAATPLPTQHPPVSLPVAPEPLSFEQLVTEYTTMTTTGFLTAEDMGLIYAQVGTNLPDLQINESARRAVVAQMKAIYAQRTSPTGMGLPG